VVTIVSRAAHEQQPQGSRQQRSTHHHHHTLEYCAIGLCSTPLLHLLPFDYTFSSTAVNFFSFFFTPSYQYPIHPTPAPLHFAIFILFMYLFLASLQLQWLRFMAPLSETCCCCYDPALPSLSSACPEHVPINRVFAHSSVEAAGAQKRYHSPACATRRTL